ncbi:MAG: hypothetical protein Q8M76_05215 [Spirochaetaceae bacterium]|nr:hypothetical protein [Spirochaetaceae bacterium]
MASRKSGYSVNSAFFLQMALGVFFIMLGIMGVTNYNSKLSEVARFFGKNDAMNIVIAIVELAMGAILVLGLFAPISGNLAKIISIALFALWALYILVRYFFNDFAEPDFVPWLYNLSWHAVILVSLWMVGKKYMN